MLGNRRVTFDFSPRQSSPPTLGGSHSSFVLPSPEVGVDELTNQISTLRTELRDGRLLQARQRSQLGQEATHIADLTRRYKDVRQESQELKSKLVYERDAAVAIQKRFNVAVKNHAEAQDKCARTMIECEQLRMLNEKLSLLNKDLGDSKGEIEAEFEEKIAEIECAYRDKAEELETAFVRELEQSQEKLTNGLIEETKALKKELDNRDAKIKKLESDLNRQCEINAMFTLNYDRDTNFTKHISMPLVIPVPETTTGGVTSGQLGSTKYQPSSPRRPLIHLESNNVTTRKRSRIPSGRGDKDDYSLSKAGKSSLDKETTNKLSGYDDKDRSHKRARPNHLSVPTSREPRSRSQPSLHPGMGSSGCY